MRQITSKHIEITSEMKTAAFDVLDGFEKYGLTIEREHVIIKKESHAKGDDIFIEFILTVRNHDSIVLHENGEDYYATLSNLSEKGEKAIRRMHDKDISSRRKNEKLHESEEIAS